MGEGRSGRRSRFSVGLTRLCDNLVAQLQELNRSKPRGKADENIAEITRLESAITIARDDLVRSWYQQLVRDFIAPLGVYRAPAIRDIMESKTR
jgi:hypothetical protein